MIVKEECIARALAHNISEQAKKLLFLRNSLHLRTQCLSNGHLTLRRWLCGLPSWWGLTGWLLEWSSGPGFFGPRLRCHFLRCLALGDLRFLLLFFLALLLFFFFCNTSPKPQLQCSQEASPIYIESPTSPSQGSAGRQAGVTAAAGRCKVVNYATKWTSQKWSPHTPCQGAVADNLGVLSGRVPVLSGYPIIRGKHWYIGRETRGSGGGGGGGSGRPGRGGSPTGERRKWHSTRMV